MAFEYDEYLQAIENRFNKDGFHQHREVVNGLEVTVATAKEFRLSWMATRMHYFGIFGAKDHVTQQDAEKFSQASFELAKRKFTGMRGMMQGFASISALASNNVDLAAKQWVEHYQKKHFSSFELPVIIDLSTYETLYCRKKPWFGRIYYNSFFQFIIKYYKP